MTRTLISSLLALALAIGLQATSDARTPLPQPGEYVSVEYLKVLEATRSPLQAEGSRDFNVIEVDRIDGDSVSAAVVQGMHEGAVGFQISRDGSVSQEWGGGKQDEPFVLRVVASDRLQFGYANHAPTEFVRVPDLQAHLRQVVIAGRYVDAAGTHYAFTGNGKAATPQGGFQYAVGEDHRPYSFDYIEDSASHAVYKVVREGCGLDLYTVEDAAENEHGNDGSHATLWHSLRREGCLGTAKK